MVTKKTRWLSAIAAVIMLVSMFAGIVVPAGAAAKSDVLNALKEKYDLLEQEDFLEVRGHSVAEMRDEIAKQIASYEATNLAHEREIYERIGAQLDAEFMAENKGNLVSGLIVRYAAKGVYEELGHSTNASSYYISTVEDWEAAAAANSNFARKTLLVTDDIDFGGKLVDPLTKNEDSFQGVLDGQGHRLIDMVIEIGDTSAERQYKYGGLVASLTGGTIKNLGLEGGAVNFNGLDVVTDRNEGVGSFAGYIGAGGLLQNCWSTMTITNKGSVIADGKNGVSGLIGWGEGGAIDNCFFAGTVNNTGDRTATDLIGYTANAVKVYNSIGAGTLNCGASRNPAAVGVHYTMYNDVANFSVYNTYGVGKAGIRHRANYDPYGVKDKDAAGNTIYKNYVLSPDLDITFTKDITHKFTPEATIAAYTLSSLEEAVWAVNKRFDTTYQSAERDYIISVDNNGRLYMGNKATAKNYYKVAIEGGTTATYFFEAGTKVNLLSDLGLMVSDNITIDKKAYASALVGYDLTVPAEDITIFIEYSNDLDNADLGAVVTALTIKLQQYEKLDFSLFDCAQLLEDWVSTAKAELAKEEKDIETLKALIDLEDGEDGFRSVMGLLPGIYPNAQDYEVYQEFNNGKEWAITSVKDWLVMIDLSETNTFEGDTFHVLNNIDFDDQKMDPLNYFEGQFSVDSTGNSFKGTIEGHGNAFLNINVFVGPSNPSNPKNTAAGLIGKLGAGAVIRNFGVESGTIEVASKNYDQAATFGEMVGAATLTKVWSGVDIICNSGASSGSHGIVGHSQDTASIINGAYFYGTLITTGTDAHRALAIAGDNMKATGVFNTLGAPIVSDSIPNSKAYATMRYSSKSSTTYFANNYGVNIPADYTNIGNANTTDMVASVLEGAYKINQGNRGLTGANGEIIKAVYFTMKDGKVAFGADDGSDQIRKITFVNKGSLIGEMYAAAGTTVVLSCDKALGYDSIKEGYVSTLDTENGTLALGNEDVTIEIVIDNTEALATQTAALRALIAKYESLNLDEFANGAEIGAWKTAAEKAIADEDLEALNLAIAQEQALADALTLKEGFWPEFTKYETYKEFNKNNDWLIGSKADWEAMEAYAKATTETEYFDGFTFHLKQDVSFGGTQMYPLGVESSTKKIFSGTIDGHGFGFKDVNIYYHKDSSTGKTTYYGDDVGGSIGLFAFLGNCEIRDFGIYNGVVESKTGNGKCNVSTFGTVVKDTTTVFTRVWSGLDMIAPQNAHLNALVGLYNNENATVKVNGFIFNGSMAKAKKHSTEARNTAFAVIGGISAAPADSGEFFNIITTPTIVKNITASFILGYTDATAFGTAVTGNKLKNVYGFGDVAQSYREGTSGQTAGNTTVGGVNYAMINKSLSMEAAAWNINNNQDSTGKEPVYFTVKNGEVWYGNAENQIRRVLVMDGNEVVKTYYAVPGNVITLDAINSDYMLPAGSLSTLDGTKLTLGNEDLIINIAACAHKNVSYSHIAGTATHTMHCADCGKDFTLDCTLGAWTANDDLVIENGAITAGTHSAVCAVCGGTATENCQGTLVLNSTDCTADGTFTFDCCNRADEVAVGSGNATHTFQGNWTEEGAPVGKEIDVCAHCEAYQVRSSGRIDVSTGNLVYAGQSVDVVITLPYALNSASIEIAPAVDSKYAITNVVGAGLTMENLAEANGAYTASLKDVQAGATITVTVQVEQFGFVEDGLLNVKVTNAKNAEGDVTDTTEQAVITLNRYKGDANADNALSIMDALLVLQHSVGQTVQIHTANAEMNDDGTINAMDAMLIVREWMKVV